MAVTYPKKLSNKLSARDLMKQVVQKRDLQMLFLNGYRFNEQRSCLELTNLIEVLNGSPAELARDLSHHVNDEARHAAWLTDLLYDLGEDISNPPTSSYIDELNRLQDPPSSNDKQGAVIAALASINAAEKRGCQTFSAHIFALSHAPQNRENDRILSTLQRILPEEAMHVRWGNRWLGRIARQSAAHRDMVDHAKSHFSMIEHAAYAAGMDITAGAELRRLSNLVDITNSKPLLERPGYFLDRLPQTLISPDLHKSRVLAARRAWNEKPEKFFETFVPMFFAGLKDLRPSGQPIASTGG